MFEYFCYFRSKLQLIMPRDPLYVAQPLQLNAFDEVAEKDTLAHNTQIYAAATGTIVIRVLH